MLMNKFAAFEDAAMLNMHALSNTVHRVRKGGERRRQRRDKNGWVEGDVVGRKGRKIRRRSGSPFPFQIILFSFPLFFFHFL